jgi:transposase-like protein
MATTKPPYPEEFRTEAARLIRSSGRPIKEIASNRGVSEQTLRNWFFAAQVDAGELELQLQSESRPRTGDLAGTLNNE